MHKLAYRIFDIAEETLGSEDPYLLQQMALYEMNRSSGNMGKATSLLERASGIAPRSRIIKHSLAVLHLKKADLARNDLEKLHSISAAERICRDLKRGFSGWLMLTAHLSKRVYCGYEGQQTVKR